MQLAAAGAQELLSCRNPDLLERLEAVGDESGAEDIDARCARRGKRDQRRLGIRLQPFRIAEARLERHAPLAFVEPQLCGQELPGFKTLLFVRLAASLRQAVE